MRNNQASQRALNGLVVRRGVPLAPRGGHAPAVADVVYLPSSSEEAELALFHASGHGPAPRVAFGGAERSFEAHFVPSERASSRVVVSSKRLRGDVRLLERTSGESGEVLRVRALAGTTFAELLRAVHQTGAPFMPFSCPTADGISLGGALAVNTHSRNSHTYGGLFAEHVRAFRLLGPDGQRYACRADAGSALERELFRAVPGAFGALGLVTELELELAAIAPDAQVVVEVLAAHDADPLRATRSYLEHVQENGARGVALPWSEGLGLVFFGAPAGGRAVLMGRRLGGATEPRRSTLPLFRVSAELNLLTQALSHRHPEAVGRIAARVLRPGRSFHASYYRWAFFQSSYDDGAARLARRGRPILWEALGLDADFGLVHQGFVVAGRGLEAFMALAAELFEHAEYRPVARSIEFFDVLPLPPPAAPLDVSRSLGGSTHVVTLSLAVRDSASRELAAAFCRDLSETLWRTGVPAAVQLNKQHHVSVPTLRAMHHSELETLRDLKRAVDPEGIFASRTLDRLGI